MKARHDPTVVERGQSTVEFVLVLPLIIVVFLALVQAGVIVQSQIGVTHTAREVARVLAVDPTADPHAAAIAAGALKAERLTVSVHFESSGIAGRQFVLVRVDYVVPAISAVVGALGEFTVTARAAMLVET